MYFWTGICDLHAGSLLRPGVSATSLGKIQGLLVHRKSFEVSLWVRGYKSDEVTGLAELANAHPSQAVVLVTQSADPESTSKRVCVNTDVGLARLDQ